MAQLGQALFVCGDQSGVGKTSVCIGLLNALSMKFSCDELAYIKPCTQCEGVQLLWKFCNQMGIHCEGLGPIIYYKGYTQECIGGQHGTASDRMAQIQAAVDSLRSRFKFVVVDGVGYPGVGSCVGCSNGQMAAALNIPVLMVSRPGVGNMIDSCVMNIEYMAFHGARTIGTIVNKLPAKKVSYHTADSIKEYCTTFFLSYQYPLKDTMHSIRTYGFIPAFNDESGSCAVTCALKHRDDPITPEELVMNEDDFSALTTLLKAQNSRVDFNQIFEDVALFYSDQQLE